MQNVVASTVVSVAHLSQSDHIFISLGEYFPELGVLCVSSVANFLILLVCCIPYFTRGAKEISKFIKNSSA